MADRIIETPAVRLTVTYSTMEGIPRNGSALFPDGFVCEWRKTAATGVVLIKASNGTAFASEKRRAPIAVALFQAKPLEPSADDLRDKAVALLGQYIAALTPLIGAADEGHDYILAQFLRLVKSASEDATTMVS